MPQSDSTTVYAVDHQRSELVDVLESYLCDLENGEAPDELRLLAEHPDLADELKPYLGSLRMLHGATRDLRPQVGGAEENEPARRQIGDYRILREIGRGGMGIVYEAHQISLNRQVALKILPFAAVLDQRQIARFRNEAQAAAQLHHPHIVPVFAVGQEQGVYYYAMQYIAGHSLEQAIDELRAIDTEIRSGSTKAKGIANGTTATLHSGITKRWPTGADPHNRDVYSTVARLGLEAAYALHHAHEHGIVHRDVKPSNLLLDEQGKLWVTDFGLARMQSDKGVTLTGDVVGTLRYMSPEQAGGQPIVDARSDVYSLGVTLYELLTRRQAFAGADRAQLLRQIIEDEPIAPRRLDPAIPADLETIVLSAMAKAPGERYPSAIELAEDLERFLAGKPTLAKRPSMVDRAAKWARRHRALVALATVAMIVVSVVSVTALALVIREQARTSAALVEAEASARDAAEHFQQARGAVDRFGIRMADRLSSIPGAEGVRRDLLLVALDYYHEFIEDAGSDPKLQQETANAHLKTAAIAAQLGATTDAIDQYRKALQLFSSLAKNPPGQSEWLTKMAVTHNNVALLLAARGDSEGAKREHEAAIAIRRKLLDDQPENAEFTSQLAESQANLGMLLADQGEAEVAIPMLGSARDVLRAIVARKSDPKYARHLAIALNNLSYVTRKNDVAAAHRSSREAIAILEGIMGRDDASADIQGDLALCYNNMAALESAQGKWPSAISWYQQAIALQVQMARKAPGIVRYRSDLAVSFNNLGVAQSHAANSKEADHAFAKSRALLATLATDYPDQLAYSSALAALLNNQATALVNADRHEEAIAIYPEAIQAQRECWQQRSETAELRESLSKMYYNYAEALTTLGRFKEARAAALARRELWAGHGERLFGVAVQLAEISQASDAGSSAKSDMGLDMKAVIIDVLESAWQQGWHPSEKLAYDERFRFLHDDKRFRALLQQADGVSPQTKPRSGPHDPTPRDN